MNVSLVNCLWYISSRGSARTFHRAAQDVAQTQEHLLQTYLRHNRNTAYVAEHFPDLPLSIYEDYVPYIERIADGESKVLTAEPVLMFECSSGSTAASKMIPYTRTLRSEFTRGLAVWISDLFTHHSALRSGPAYWSISPLTEGRRQTRGGIPIGFEEDSAYLGPLGTWIETGLAVPNLVKNIQDVRAFRYVTLLFLLRCEELRLISIWNPTFLTLLMEPLSQCWDSLLRDIHDGTLTPPVLIDPNIQKLLVEKLSPDTRRAKTVSKLNPHDYTSIWPHLTVISCWADGASKPYAEEVKARFPGVTLQPKGLLATEAFVSLPLIGEAGHVPAITSHYFEFLSEDGDVRLLHELEKSKVYSVVVTTGGGLYRYQLNDIVEVTGFYHQVPCLKFLGKGDRVSDYFGEKLSEPFVSNVLERLFESHHLAPIFAMLVPEQAGGFHYTLFLEIANQDIPLPTSLTSEFDSALRENFHYDYCRKLGQLGEARIIRVTRGIEVYTEVCRSRGQRLGDVKPAILLKTLGWAERFADLVEGQKSR